MKEYIFQSSYDESSLGDIGREVEEAVNAEYNEGMKNLDLVEGKINVTITYTKETK